MTTTSVSLRPCRCRYQEENNCGYQVLKWIGGKLSLKTLAGAANLGDAVVLAARNQGGVLIRCNGCGAELVRETGDRQPEGACHNTKPKGKHRT